MSRLSRRSVLAGAAALLAAGPARAAQPRVATLDWALLETLLAMGVAPVAAAELVLFRQVAVEPLVPQGVIDVGLRGMPNFEALRRAAPDLIFNSAYYVAAEPKLRLIAPVETISIYRRGAPPFVRAEEAARRLAEATSRPEAAERLVAATQETLANCRAALAGWGARPLLVINLGDARHFRVFGPDSMFGEVLARLGLANAWTSGTSYAASAPVGLEALARFADAGVVILPPVPPDARRILPQSAVWRALPSVRENRVVVLGSMNPFGGLPTAMRFARLLTQALTHPPGAGLG
ncbi:iron-siderophore ABC transporter substrate-binding protein [Xanthobacter tagetidis]|uniref:Iron-siderophore ABC transporter substrate-binding protein n=1 Tax=Xanthobacter tagetidis TaxID=60216 RepID=A0A3L7ACD8_9HYPH|nr:iron-siderophore ABC transporter substrate-binding protein [Xanthobacter tagetidis]MBB6306087.1 iron complex transport system substrate-binding protein [Xanthobacter tagetidis]RLP77644.1 iron-siderophore ABC transporter substrate-binding protein [Xanthobacter tagetidis]